MRLYFARHGESEANLLSEFSNTGWKHPLTKKGREQVEGLAGKLAGQGLAAIYSSPLQRAVESAEILAERLGVPRYVSGALVEYSVGIYEGRSDTEGWKRYAEALDEWFEKGNLDARMEEGESFNDMAARLVPFIGKLKDRYRDVEGGVVLVSHGGLYRCVLPLVLPNVSLAFSREHTLDHTSFVEAELRRDDLICVNWAGIEGSDGRFGT